MSVTAGSTFSSPRSSRRSIVSVIMSVSDILDVLSVASLAGTRVGPLEKIWFNDQSPFFRARRPMLPKPEFFSLPRFAPDLGQDVAHAPPAARRPGRDHRLSVRQDDPKMLAARDLDPGAGNG